MSRSGKSSHRGRGGWSAAIAEWRASDLSAEEFCRRRGLVRSTFQWWRWRLGREAAEQAAASPPELVPVRVIRSVPAAEEESVAVLELVLSSGTLVRVPEGFDARTVAGVLWALNEVGQC
jgi:hypothetical protein